LVTIQENESRRKKMKLAGSLLALAAIVPASASAHPDHLAGGTHGLGHLATDPFHLALAAAAVALAVVLRRAVVRRRATQRHSA